MMVLYFYDLYGARVCTYTHNQQILTALMKLLKNVMSLKTSTVFNPSQSLIRTFKRANFEVGATVLIPIAPKGSMGYTQGAVLMPYMS